MTKLRTWRCSPSCTNLLCCLTSKSVMQPGWSTWVQWQVCLRFSGDVRYVQTNYDQSYVSLYRPTLGCSVWLSIPTSGCQCTTRKLLRLTEARRGLKLLLTSSPSLTMPTSTCCQVKKSSYIQIKSECCIQTSVKKHLKRIFHILGIITTYTHTRYIKKQDRKIKWN